MRFSRIRMSCVNARFFSFSRHLSLQLSRELINGVVPFIFLQLVILHLGFYVGGRWRMKFSMTYFCNYAFRKVNGGGREGNSKKINTTDYKYLVKSYCFQFFTSFLESLFRMRRGFAIGNEKNK